MAAAIDHPSILPIYEAGEFEEQPFIVMRHVAGTDLKTLIERKGRLEPRRAVEITCRHRAAPSTPRTAAGLVHRDVKPANILIGEEADDEEVVYLTDFGLTKGRSRRAPDPDRQVGRHGRLHGARADRGQGRSTGASDEYALGLRALRGAHGHRAVPARERRPDHVGAHPRRPAAAEPGAAGARPGHGRGDRARHGQGARGRASRPAASSPARRPEAVGGPRRRRAALAARAGRSRAAPSSAGRHRSSAARSSAATRPRRRRLPGAPRPGGRRAVGRRRARAGCDRTPDPDRRRRGRA